MKQLLQLFSFLLVLTLAASACSSNETPDTPNVTFIKGTVENVQPGKDGYTAKIRTEKDSVYFVTVSHANLRDPAQYKAAAVGDVLEVRGNIWKLDGDTHIKVREMK